MKSEILPIFNNISCYHSISKIYLYQSRIGLVVIIGEIISLEFIFQEIM